MSHYFDQNYRSGSRENAEAHALREHEAALVRYVLRRFKLTCAEKHLTKRHQELTTVRALTFSAFNAEFPTFPFLLGYSHLDGLKLHRCKAAEYPNLYKTFQDVPYVAPYLQFAEQSLDICHGRSVCLVVPRRGFQYGLAVHDSANGSGWAGGGCFVYKGRNHRRSYTVYVRPFSAVIDEVFAAGKGWNPES